MVFVFNHLGKYVTLCFSCTASLSFNFSLQKELQPGKTLKQAVETRWNTRLAMLQSISDALKSGMLHNILLRRKETRFLKNIEPELLEQLIKLLTPYDEATRHLSSEKSPTLHLVLPTKSTLLNGCKIEDGDSAIVKEVIGLIFIYLVIQLTGLPAR